MKKNTHSYSTIHRASKAGVLTLALLSALKADVKAADILWQGGADTYNKATNWAGGVIPGSGDNAINGNGLANTVQINSGDPDWTVNDFRTGGASDGSYVQNGQTVSANGWFILGAGNGVTGVATLNGGTLNVNGGRLFLGDHPGSTSILNINGGILNKNGDVFVVADGGWNGSGARTGTVNQTNGTVNCGSEVWLGQTSPGLGIYNLSGGTINAGNWFAIGRGGGTGVFNMTGGSIVKNGGGHFMISSEDGGASVGTLNHSAGIIADDSEYWIANGGASTGTNNISGTASVTVNNWVAIGRGGNGYLNMSGGSLTKTGNGGNHLLLAAFGNSGTINQTGGGITNVTSDAWIGESGVGTWNLNGGFATLASIHLGQNGSATGTLNVNGGLLTASEITSGNNVAVSTLNLNGGVVRSSGDTTRFIHDVLILNVQAGGAVIDSQGFDVTVPIALPTSGDPSGGLTKLGSGVLRLTGLNTYAGPTVVSNGLLVITTDPSGAGDYTVNGGAALSLTVQSLNAQLNVGNFTLGTGASSLSIDLGAFGTNASAPINASGALTVNGTATLNIADGLPSVGQIPIIKYGSKTGVGSIVLGSIPVGLGAYLSNNVANKSIDLVVTNVNLPRWDGVASGDWDTTTLNWINIGNGSSTTFGQGNAVVFNDSAAGTTTVNLATTVNPNGISVNNSSLAYTFTGGGKIGGSGGLTKQGSASLVIANTVGNTYTGATTIAGGTLSVSSLANGGSASSIGAATASPTNLVINGGNLTYTGPATSINRGYTTLASTSSITVSNNLSLSGSMASGLSGGMDKSGLAQLAYTGTGTNALTGSGSPGYIVHEGTVVFNGSVGGQTNIILGDRLGLNGLSSVPSVLATNTTLNLSGNLDLGNETGASSTMTLDGSSTLNIGGWLVFGDGGNGTNTFTLNNGTMNINSGNILMGGRPGGLLTLNINGGVLNKSGGVFDVADGGWNGSGARTGIVNQTGGTVNNSDELYVGYIPTGMGYYNLSNGIVNQHNWFVIARGGGTGTMNMTGGTFNKDNNGAFINSTGGGSVGIFNHSAGTLNSSSEYWSAESGAIATNNISGTAVENIGTWVTIGRNGLGVVNMTGGTFNQTGGDKFVIGIYGGGNGTWNQSAGAVNLANEVWIGQGGATGVINLTGGGITNNSWLAVGREGGTGFLNISGGTYIKAGGGNTSISHGGGPGTVTVTSGLIDTSSGETWIGEDSNTGTWTMNGGTARAATVHLAQNANANGILNLNGGTFSASEVSTGNTGSANRTLNLNGGTLAAAADNANFIHDLSAANVQTGGAIFDTASHTVSVNQALLGTTADGGLTKNGAGTLYLNGVNTYTNLTAVSAGALGGSGTIAGNVNVASTARLAPGTASFGALTVNGNVNLASGSSTLVKISLFAGVTNNDMVVCSGTVSYNGTLVVTNAGGTILPNGGKFKLFNAANHSGNFTSVSILPSGSGTFDSTTGILTIAPQGPITVNSASVAGGRIVLSGAGGKANGTYSVLTSTNVALPLSTWTSATTGVFSATGTFSNSVPVSLSEPARFYRIQTP